VEIRTLEETGEVEKEKRKKKTKIAIDISSDLAIWAGVRRVGRLLSLVVPVEDLGAGNTRMFCILSLA
jgi:hypothetical protein